MNISLTAFAAFSCNKLVSIVAEVLHESAAFLLNYHSSYRNSDNKVLTLLAVALLLHSILTILSLILLLILEVHQSSEISVSKKYDVAAVTAVTTVWTAFWNEWLSSERYSTISALAGYYFDFRFIYKHCLPLINIKKPLYA